MIVKNTTSKEVVLVEKNNCKVVDIVHRLHSGQDLYLDTDRTEILLEIQDDSGQKTRPKKGWVETLWGYRPYPWNALKETQSRQGRN